MKQDAINKILELANRAFLSKESPDKFARTAAYEAAHSAASRHSEECADAATLIAANEFNAATSDATTFTSRVTDAAHDCISHQRRYHAERESYEDVPVLPQKLTDKPYAVFTQPLNKLAHMTSATITSSYLSTFSKNTAENQRAKQAARCVYGHAYCAARSAYVVSFFAANRSGDPSRRQAVFQDFISMRLNEDLQYDQIKPSLFLNLMCTHTLQIIAGVILAVGVLTVLFGVLGVASLPLAETVLCGVAVGVVGIGLLIGHSFAKTELERIEDANERSEEMHNMY